MSCDRCALDCRQVKPAKVKLGTERDSYPSVKDAALERRGLALIINYAVVNCFSPFSGSDDPS